MMNAKHLVKFMLAPKPRSLFSTQTFWGFVGTIYMASIPNVIEMNKNGVTLDRVLYLGGAILTSIPAFIAKMRKEEELFTPSWMAGRNKDEAIAHVEERQKQVALTVSSGSIVKDVVQDAIASPIASVQSRAQEIVNTVANDPIKELVDDAIANPIAVIANPVGEVEDVAKKSLFQIVGSLLK